MAVGSAADAGRLRVPLAERWDGVTWTVETTPEHFARIHDRPLPWRFLPHDNSVRRRSALDTDGALIERWRRHSLEASMR